MTTGTWEWKGENRTVREGGKGAGNTFGQTRHKETEHLCILQAARRQKPAQHRGQSMYILIRKRISLGGCPKQSTFGIPIIPSGNKAKSQGHMVLTLSSLWAVSSRLPCITLALSYVPPNLGKAFGLIFFCPKIFQQRNNCLRGYNSLLHLSCHRTLFKTRELQFLDD